MYEAWIPVIGTIIGAIVGAIITALAMVWREKVSKKLELENTIILTDRERKFNVHTELMKRVTAYVEILNKIDSESYNEKFGYNDWCEIYYSSKREVVNYANIYRKFIGDDTYENLQELWEFGADKRSVLNVLRYDKTLYAHFLQKMDEDDKKIKALHEEIIHCC